jgi:hypothetical protein
MKIPTAPIIQPRGACWSKVRRIAAADCAAALTLVMSISDVPSASQNFWPS